LPDRDSHGVLHSIRVHPATLSWIGSIEALPWYIQHARGLRQSRPEKFVPAEQDKPIDDAGLRDNLGFGLAREVRLAVG
jgi:hypothetical protein